MDIVLPTRARELVEPLPPACGWLTLNPTLAQELYVVLAPTAPDAQKVSLVQVRPIDDPDPPALEVT